MKIGRGRHYRQCLVNSDWTSCETGDNVDIFKIFIIIFQLAGYTYNLLSFVLLYLFSFFYGHRED
jgi:hypothetical protein